MENLLFSFKSIHKALGGIETEVFVYEDKVTLKRKVTGIIAMNVKLPSETTVFYNDLSGMNFIKPTGINGIGWIELSGISTNGSTVKTVNTEGKMFNNVDTVNALGNPYCIAFNKDKNEVENNYNELKSVFQKYKSSNANNNVNVINTIQEESSLDKIKKLKDLLDVGAITQEEFESKKNELMKSI